MLIFVHPSGTVLTKFLKLPQPSDLIKLLTELVGEGLNIFILVEVSQLKVDEIDTFEEENNNGTYRGASSWLAGLLDQRWS